MVPNKDGKKWWILTGLWLLYASFGLIVASVAPLVGEIGEGLNVSYAAMGSIMGAWQLVYIFCAIPCGILLDRIGGRRALLLGALLVAASAAGRAVAEGYWSLLAAVMLFGLGGPIISSGAPKVVAELFEGAERGMAMGIYMTGPAIGGVICLTLTQSYLLPLFDMDWRGVMWLWSGCAAFAGIAWWGIGALFGLTEERDSVVSPRVPQLQIMRRLLDATAVKIVLLMSVGVFLYNHGLNNWLPQLLQAGGKSPVEAGFWAALPTVVGIVGSLLIPRLATPARRFRILILLCVVAVLATILLHSQNEINLSVGLVLQGIARSSLMTVLVLTLVELPGIGERYAGVASGLFFTAAEVGGVLGPLGIGVVYDVTGAFTLALTILTGVAALLLLGALYLNRLSSRGAAAD